MQTIKTTSWAKTHGNNIYLYTLTNSSGMQVTLSNIGAAIQSVLVPDKYGIVTDVALGYDNAKDYLDDPFYVGTVVGRYANRIAGGKVNIDGQNYQLTVKEGGFHHHGGKHGFNKKIWEAQVLANENAVVFSLLSPDGDEGFPGNLSVQVKYTLTDQNQLIVDFTGVCDKATLINLTQHIYFNLAGHNQGSILNHQLMINAAQYLPVNDMVVPNGQLTDVADTPFDFRTAKKIGLEIDADNAQLNLGSGYDHSWVLKTERSSALVLAAKAYHQTSGRMLTVYTTEPAVHVYTGNFLDDTVTGKSNTIYERRDGFCLETQNYPDAPNKPNFPDPVLKAGEKFESKTIFEFGLN
jgi:aldose 1-epimerase